MGSAEQEQIKVYIFFPVFNEGSAAAALLERIGKIPLAARKALHVLIVDDGSTDDSIQHIRSVEDPVPYTLLQHEQNKGLLSAMETGLSWLGQNTNPNDVVVLMDGDDTHDPFQIGDMLVELDQGSEIVIASRYRPGSQIHGLAAYRKWLSAGAFLLGAALFHIRGVRDYTCGYRAVRASVLQQVCRTYGDRVFEIKGYGFICSVELLLKLSDCSSKFSEIPMILHYGRKEVQSKMNVPRMIMGFFVLWYSRLGSSKPLIDS